jgi:hypothetical protein
MASGASSKTTGDYAEQVVHPDGSVSIGVTVDGVFLPFVTLDAVQVADRVEAGKSPEAKEARGETEGEG